MRSPRPLGPGDAVMTGPAWLAGGLAVLMIIIAVYCAGRLAVSRLRGQGHRSRHRRTAYPDGRRDGRDVRAAADPHSWRRLARGVRRGSVVRLAGHPRWPPAQRTLRAPGRPRRRMRRHGVHGPAGRLLACYKIAMAITMRYMLILML